LFLDLDIITVSFIHQLMH